MKIAVTILGLAGPGADTLCMRTPAGQAVRAAILLVLGLATLAVVSQTVPDVDLWGHVTFGRDIVESGIIRQPDVYSFTDDKEWIMGRGLCEWIGWNV